MEKSASIVQHQENGRELVEDIMIKKEIKSTKSNNLTSGSVNAVQKEEEGILTKGLKMLWRKSWQSIRQVEAEEIDAVFSPEIKHVQTNNSEQQKRVSDVSPNKVTKTEVNETDAVSNREILASKSNKSNFNPQKKPHKTSLKVKQKKEEKCHALCRGAIQSSLGGGGHFVGRK